VKIISTEKFIEQLQCEIYPITIVKYLLNKKRILGYFSKASDKNFDPKQKYIADPTDCPICQQKKDMLCRQHTSIDRVLKAQVVGLDADTNVYFFRNEIFKMVGNRLVIVYCPHPKLISGDITDSKVRKINPITIEDPNVAGLPLYEPRTFLSTELMDQSLKCWFNNEFSLVTIPEDRNLQNWCLVPNK
jgi:hypothetical protein